VLSSVLRHHLPAAMLVLAASPPTADAQASSIRPTVWLALQDQYAQGEDVRVGGVLAVGVWLGKRSHVRERLELGVGSYSLLHFDVANAAAEVGSDGPFNGFPAILSLSVATVLRLKQGFSSSPFTSIGFTALRGFGNPRGHSRRAIAPDFGIGYQFDGSVYFEARNRWMSSWDPQPFGQFSLGFGWHGN
jgi:hypothetical protein